MLHVDTGAVSTQMMKHQLSFIYITSLVDRYGDGDISDRVLTVYNIHIVVAAVSCGCMVECCAVLAGAGAGE